MNLLIKQSHILSKSGLLTKPSDNYVHYLINKSYSHYFFSSSFSNTTYKMGPKRVKRSDSHSDEDYAPKKEDDIKIKLETKEDDIVPMIVDTPRYVHDNPREFKGRLGYA